MHGVSLNRAWSGGGGTPPSNSVIHCSVQGSLSVLSFLDWIQLVQSFDSPRRTTTEPSANAPKIWSLLPFALLLTLLFFFVLFYFVCFFRFEKPLLVATLAFCAQNAFKVTIAGLRSAPSGTQSLHGF